VSRRLEPVKKVFQPPVFWIAPPGAPEPSPLSCWPLRFETFEKIFCGHPEIVSGPKNMMILLDAEASYA